MRKSRNGPFFGQMILYKHETCSMASHHNWYEIMNCNWLINWYSRLSLNQIKPVRSMTFLRLTRIFKLTKGISMKNRTLYLKNQFKLSKYELTRSECISKFRLYNFWSANRVGIFILIQSIKSFLWFNRYIPSSLTTRPMSATMSIPNISIIIKICIKPRTEI